MLYTQTYSQLCAKFAEPPVLTELLYFELLKHLSGEAYDLREIEKILLKLLTLIHETQAAEDILRLRDFFHNDLYLNDLPAQTRLQIELQCIEVLSSLDLPEALVTVSSHVFKSIAADLSGLLKNPALIFSFIWGISKTFQALLRLRQTAHLVGFLQNYYSFISMLPIAFHLPWSVYEILVPQSAPAVIDSVIDVLLESEAGSDLEAVLFRLLQQLSRTVYERCITRLLESSSRGDRLRLLSVVSGLEFHSKFYIRRRLADVGLNWYEYRNLIQLLGAVGSRSDSLRIAPFLQSAEDRIQTEAIRAIATLDSERASEMICYFLDSYSDAVLIEVFKTIELKSLHYCTRFIDTLLITRNFTWTDTEVELLQTILTYLRRSQDAIAVQLQRVIQKILPSNQ